MPPLVHRKRKNKPYRDLYRCAVRVTGKIRLCQYSTEIARYCIKMIMSIIVISITTTIIINQGNRYHCSQFNVLLLSSTPTPLPPLPFLIILIITIVGVTDHPSPSHLPHNSHLLHTISKLGHRVSSQLMKPFLKL